MTTKADGRLRHHFHGTYSATIILQFPSGPAAALALPKLGAGWETARNHPEALVWSGESAALESVKAILGSFGADTRKIDSCAKSLDYGEPFTCTFSDIASVPSDASVPPTAASTKPTAAPTKPTNGKRTLASIAAEIRADWPRPYFAAAPYLEAMSALSDVSDTYGADSGKSIVAYFLGNASAWRGPTAKRVKAELKRIAGIK
jgi:hypothetical protein